MFQIFFAEKFRKSLQFYEYALNYHMNDAFSIRIKEAREIFSMNILVVGGGGREHAIAYWLSKSMPKRKAAAVVRRKESQKGRPRIP